jgi:apolipoprotein N-acyltransferase
MESKRDGILALLVIVATAVLCWFGTGLHPFWLLAWLLPIPALLAAPRMHWGTALLSSFAGFALGSLNQWRYLHDFIQLPMGVVIFATAGPALMFAISVLVFRRLYLQDAPVRAALAFAFVWVAMEFLQELSSPHSTWGNLAYTQSDNLPVKQIASVTGVWGVSFCVMAVSALFSATLLTRDRKRVGVVLAVVFLGVLCFGFARVATTPNAQHLRVVLLATDARSSLFPHKDDAGVALARSYANKIDAMPSADIVIVPEKIASMSDTGVQEADAIFAEAARIKHEYVLYGVDHRTGDKTFNQSRLFSPNGELLASYDKHHLVPGIERVDSPGTHRIVLDLPTGRVGLTICKDMDFPRLSREYGRDGAALLLVPAWDFVLDDWYHDRMAVMRGVESGFSIARAAKQGLLTVSDSRGRVIAEQSSAQTPFGILVTDVPFAHARTIYARFGDWFGWVAVIAAVALFASSFRTGQSLVRRAHSQAAD